MRKRELKKSADNAGSERLAYEARSRQEDGQFVVALARGMEVLASFGSDDDELSNSELAKRTGFSKPTLTRLTFTLMKTGYLRYNEAAGTYSLAPRVVSLASPYLKSRAFIARIQPDLETIAHISGGSAAIAARRNLDMVYLSYVRSANSFGLLLDLGATVPISSTSHGSAYLGELDDEELEAFAIDFQRAHPEADVDFRSKGRMYRERLRTDGYCAAFGEWNPNVNAAATAFRLPGLREIYTINCGGHASQVTKDVIHTVGPYLKRLREALMGYDGR
ncbi:IclR family transcriptional regulator [Aliihoeflea sp. PC F10.4]